MAVLLLQRKMTVNTVVGMKLRIVSHPYKSTFFIAS